MRLDRPHLIVRLPTRRLPSAHEPLIFTLDLLTISKDLSNLFQALVKLGIFCVSLKVPLTTFCARLLLL